MAYLQKNATLPRHPLYKKTGVLQETRFFKSANFFNQPGFPTQPTGTGTGSKRATNLTPYSASNTAFF